MMKQDWDRRAAWWERAQALKPALLRWEVPAAMVVEPVLDETAMQGVRMRPVGEAKSLAGRVFRKGERFTVDFGETLVGRLRVELRPEGKNDSPLRLKFYAAELPYEAAADPDDCDGDLSRAWMQDEIVNFDVLPGTYTLPRRYSLRYLRIEVLAVAEGVAFEDIRVIAEAAEKEIPSAPEGLTPERAAIDRAGLRTLRNCMQLVMEDGPKRDRRLWLGDLRLQARANAVSYRRFDLIERSLLILAAAADDEGRVPGCVYTEPLLRRGNDTVDYSLLFGPTLDDLVRETGNLEPARDLYPLAVRQFELVKPHFDADGLYRADAPGWHFIDWAVFDRRMAAQGVVIYSLRALARLATRLGLPEEAAEHEALAGVYATILRKRGYDPERQLVLTGGGEVSYASQIWAILAGVFTPEEAAGILRAAAREPGAVQPVTPYLQHHLLEALMFAGMREEAFALIDRYWGGMIKAGADTFWEVWVPGQELLSPYRDALLNSACHAWSCTPSCFLRG